jgi:hypothetical protein
MPLALLGQVTLQQRIVKLSTLLILARSEDQAGFESRNGPKGMLGASGT